MLINPFSQNVAQAMMGSQVNVVLAVEIQFVVELKHDIGQWQRFLAHALKNFEYRHQ